MIPPAKLRIAARERRRELARSCPDFALRIAGYASGLPIPPGAKVASFMALPDEADPKLLAETLVKKGCEICFPRVHQKAQPLQFHVPAAGEHMARGAFGVLEPLPHWPASTPDVVLVPLLAFDADGYRLGYGGGYYDRTLELLHASHPVIAIGIAFAGQQMDDVQRHPGDQPLDMLVTEAGIRPFDHHTPGTSR